MLMLDHKQVPYRRVEFVTLLHPVAARLHGFNGGGETRRTGGRRTPGLLLGDRLGTVPGLNADGERISTNRQIARFLDERHPEPALFPEDPQERRAVEAAENWANEELQMAARRIVFAAVVRDSAGMSRVTGDGRMGCLLYRQERVRRVINPLIGRQIFATRRGSDPQLLDDLDKMLDRIDSWIGEGVLSAQKPNAADFMVAPSLALILYRPDVRSRFEDRPALGLVDRLLPEPAAVR
jgi:glutathione S-transferase